MNDWQSTCLESRALPRDLSDFESEAFFTFSESELVSDHGHESLTYFAFPSNHWRQIRTNSQRGRIIRKIRRVPAWLGRSPMDTVR
jgi:transposase-like protein